MQTAKSRRSRSRRWAIAVSAVVHAAVLTVVAFQRPMLQQPAWQGGPPEPVIPVLILPRNPPPVGGHAAPLQPIRLHRRLQPNLPTPIAPLPIPEAPAKPQTTTGPVEARSTPAFHPAPLPEGPKGEVKQALRQSYVGCANQDTVGMNRAERDACDEKFGKGAKDTAFAGLGLSADKQKLLDAAGAKKEADYRYTRGGAVQTRAIGATPLGQTAEQSCIAMGVAPEECSAHVKR
jgi:hypothetical protein